MTPDHVGLYLGDKRFVHAEKKAGRLIITDLNSRGTLNIFWAHAVL